MIKKLIQRIKDKRKQREYCVGYGWAMTAYYLEGCSLEEIGISCDIDNKTSFDYGAIAAIRELNQNHEMLDQVIANLKFFFNRIEELESFIENAQVSSDVCCCGENMETHSHPMDSGHEPLDIWTHSKFSILSKSTNDERAKRFRL